MSEKTGKSHGQSRKGGGVYLIWCHKSQIIYRIRLDETRNQNQISRTRLVLFFLSLVTLSDDRASSLCEPN